MCSYGSAFALPLTLTRLRPAISIPPRRTKNTTEGESQMVVLSLGLAHAEETGSITENAAGARRPPRLKQTPMRLPTVETRPKPSQFRCLHHQAIHLQRRNERRGQPI